MSYGTTGIPLQIQSPCPLTTRQDKPFVSQRADWTEWSDGIGWDSRNEGKDLFVILDFQPDRSSHPPGNVQEALNHHLCVVALSDTHRCRPAWRIVTLRLHHHNARWWISSYAWASKGITSSLRTLGRRFRKCDVLTKLWIFMGNR